MNNQVFFDRRISPSNSNLIFKYNNYFRSIEGKYKCFIEGSTDETFYSNLKDYKFLNLDRCIYGYNTKLEQSFDKGKDSVICLFKWIRNNCQNDLKKCIFLVDHDYDGVSSSKIFVDEEEKEHFSITEPYSFENYFLSRDNIDIIFNYFNLSDIEKYAFERKLNEFVKDISEYVKRKSTTTCVCKKGNKYNCFIGKSKLYSPQEIFKFNFKDDVNYFNKELLNEENESMLNAIKHAESNKALEFYYLESNKYAGRVEYVRGHDLYSFLESYFRQMFNINLKPFSNNPNYVNIIKLLNVNIYIKNGLGETILDDFHDYLC